MHVQDFLSYLSRHGESMYTLAARYWPILERSKKAISKKKVVYMCISPMHIQCKLIDGKRQNIFLHNKCVFMYLKD